MELHQLELLLAVMDSATMTKAAEKMHLSTAAVSLQLRSLATELNTDLFVRSGRRLLPTPAGQAVADHARSIVGQVQKIRQEFASDAQQDTRPFRFATGATTLIYRLARPLRRLRERFPHLDLHISVLSTEQMIAGLLDRQFDLALISLPASNDNLRIIPLFEEELLLVRPSPTQVRGNHIGTVRSRELDGAPFLLYPKPSNMRSLIDQFLDRLELRRRVIMESADTEAIKRLVESGFGYSMLPEYALRESPRFFQTLRIAGRRLLRWQALALPVTAQPRAMTESIAAFLKQTFEVKDAT
jgi:DNA-binding transcriptional LysR family regulator